MSQLRIGAIKRTKWALIALVFIFTQFIPVINLSGIAEAATLDTGFKTPTSNNGDSSWDTNTVTLVQNSDNSYASENDESQEQDWAGFDFSSIPAGSTINGIEVKIEAKATDSSGCSSIARLSWNNGANNTSIFSKSTPITGTDASYILGGSNDTWGHTWSTAELASNKFLLRVQFDDTGNQTCDNNAVFTTDYLAAKVYYTEPVVSQTITVKKLIKDNANQSSAAGASWKFNVAGQNVTTGANGSTTAVEVATGNYSVVEAAPPVIPTDYTVTTAVCKNQNGVVRGTFSGNSVTGITVQANDKITCEFTNDLAPKVLICHADSADKKPYVQNEPNKSADVAGHDGHDGGIWTPGATNWGDIIPPFQGRDFAYTGKNWTPEGIAIWNNNCDVTPPKPTIQLVKSTVGSTNPDAWTLTAIDATGNKVINQTGTLQKDGTAATIVKEVSAGTFALSENGPDGYVASEWACTVGNYDPATNSVTLTTGQNAVCTIVNTKKVSIWVEKYIDTNNDGQAPNIEGEPKATEPFGFTLYDSTNTQVATGSTTDGALSLGSFSAGTYTVCETSKDGWSNTFAGPGTTVNDPSGLGRACVLKQLNPGDGWTFVFANYEIPKPVTIVATKIVCSKESDLPNWGNGWQDITAATASQWVQDHASCSFAPQWDFQWSNDSVGNPGDNVEYGGQGWTTFGPTNAAGTTSVQLNDVKDKKFWFREALKPGYLEFAYSTSGNSNSKSAEFYCHNDVLNYDNWEWIDNMQPGQTYYCVAWNYKKGETISGTKWLDKNANGKQDYGDTTLKDWTIFIDANNNGKLDTGEASTKTNAMGKYSFDDLQPGSYTICEEQQNGYIQTYPENKSCHSVVLDGSTVNPTVKLMSYDFGNAKAGTIIVKKKFNKWQSPCVSGGESRCGDAQPDYSLFSFSIKNESTHKVVYQGNFDDDGEVSVVVPEGKYTVTEGYSEQYWPSYKDCEDIRISQYSKKYCTITNNRKPAILDIDKQDYSIDGTKDPTIQAAPGKNTFYYIVTIKNKSNFAAQNVEMNDDLPSSLKLVAIEPNDTNWECDAPNGAWGQNIECEYDGDYPANTTTTIKLTVELKDGTKNYVKNYACVDQAYTHKDECDESKTPIDPNSTVVVTKYHDKNQNGVRDEYFNQGLEPVLAGVTFKLYSDYVAEPFTATTNQEGIAEFTNIPSGNYWIQEVAQDGWKQTQLSCEGSIIEDEISPQSLHIDESDAVLPENNEGEWFYVLPGEQADCIAGNASDVYWYNIAKTNNATTAKRVGDIVTYTITLTTPDGSGVLYSPIVGDVTPKGFAYLNGSWTATSNLRGNLVPGVSVEPTYASPGVWRFNGFDTYYDESGTVLNNAFYPGEVVTLTYQAKIQNGVSAGTYPDIALSFAFNTDEKENQTKSTAVIANVTNQDGASPFVGTEVTVVTDTPASAELINTGAGALWAILMGTGLVMAGVASRRFSVKERRMQ